ncbi:Mss4-like protein [Mycena epipterygia]|nr:Mss4-like protein [Mycena epipterygia]
MDKEARGSQKCRRTRHRSGGPAIRPRKANCAMGGRCIACILFVFLCNIDLAKHTLSRWLSVISKVFINCGPHLLAFVSGCGCEVTDGIHKLRSLRGYAGLRPPDSTTVIFLHSPSHMPTSVRAGACFCGSVSYTVTGDPTLSAYCHCSRCQVMNGSAFIWTIHFPAAAFAWTHSDPHNTVLDTYVTEGKPWKTRYRCKNCGCCVASYNDRTMAWSVWGTQLEREGGVTKNLDGVGPTAHIFYGTRLVDVNDELGKWEGYENKSTRIS